MKRITVVLTALVSFAVFVAVVPHVAAGLQGFYEVDNFEYYSSSAELSSAPWSVNSSPNPELLLAGGANGGQAMSLYADIPAFLAQPAIPQPVGPLATSVTRDLTSRNSDPYTALSFWYKAGADALPGDVLLVSLVLNGLPQQPILLNVAAANTWTRHDINLTAPTLADLDAMTFTAQRSFTALARPAAASTVAEEIAQIDEITFNTGARWTGASGFSGKAPWQTFNAWAGGPPAATTSAVIPTFILYDNYPELAANQTVANLTVESEAELYIGTHNLTVSGTLVNDGRIEQTRAINAYDTPVSFVNTGGYGGVTLSAPLSCALALPSSSACLFAAGASAALPGATTVAITGAACPGDSGGVARCFEITPTTTPTLLDVTFYFSAADLGGQNCANLNVYHYNSGTATWDQLATGTRQCSTQPYSITALGVTDFSSFALGETGPTAVSLTTFSAAPSSPWSWLRALLP